jgi:cysteinyl-tRNA synthetase
LINQNKIDPESAVKLIDCFKDIDRVLKVFDFGTKVQYSVEVQDLIKQRESARDQKNFELADKIREKLINLGVNVHDKKVSHDS